MGSDTTMVKSFHLVNAETGEVPVSNSRWPVIQLFRGRRVSSRYIALAPKVEDGVKRLVALRRVNRDQTRSRVSAHWTIGRFDVLCVASDERTPIQRQENLNGSRQLGQGHASLLISFSVDRFVPTSLPRQEQGVTMIGTVAPGKAYRDLAKFCDTISTGYEPSRARTQEY